MSEENNELTDEELAILNSRFDKSDSRFDKLDSRFDKLDSRFDKFESNMDKSFDKFESKLDSCDRILGLISKQVEGHTTTEIYELLKSQGDKIKSISKRVESIGDKVGTSSKQANIYKKITLDQG